MKTFVCQNCGIVSVWKYSTTNQYCSMTCHQTAARKSRWAEIEAGNGTAGLVKKYLIHKHGEICLDPDCAWDFTKRPIGVELEHIDGNADNNTLENCTLLCPNCHSLTDTYKGKNRGKGRAKRRDRYAAGLSY